LVIYAKIYKQLILRNSDENDDESFEVPMKKGHAKAMQKHLLMNVLCNFYYMFCKKKIRMS